MSTTRNPVELYKELKASYSAEDSWELWSSLSNKPELGIYQVNDNTKKLSFRAYDDTPSVAIYSELNSVDFGGDCKPVDPVGRIMEVTSMSFMEAVKLFLSWEGQDIGDYVRPKYQHIKEKKSEALPYKPNYIRRAIKDRISHKGYKLIYKDLFRGCSDKEIKYAENVLHIGYIPKNEDYIDRIFIPEMDEKGIPYGSYRYNRRAEPKGLIRKNSKRVLYGSHMLPKYKDSIIYCEGHSDTVVSIAKRIGAVTTGSSTKLLGKNISLLKGKTVFDFPDLDIAGMKGAMSRSVEISIFNSTCSEEEKIRHEIFWWSDWIASEKVYDKIINNKIDKADPFSFIAKKIPLKKNHAFFNIDLLEEIQADICKKKKWNLSSLSIRNWRIIFKNTSLKEGFDFVDFHEKEICETKSILLQFLNKKVKY